ncbi:MAG: hypothetical protein AUI10_11930 [Actinobacteria bacterium 13_2_20CM_2_72_6]|nr:MAG: hypothetical protein AUI10_11930 [Actinobacteria bacterium 13_2_20CM_2_72_6]
MSAELHVTNGDATDVKGSGLAERILVWRDVLHEGPVPDVAPDELRRVRAEFLAGDHDRDTLRRFEERDETLAAARDGRYVLWFEADLYCQLQLAEILARLAELAVPAERITLICIGEYPGIAHFGGLGELTAEQLRDLAATPARATLTGAALDLAARAWSALRAPQPYGLGPIAAARSGELRFLGEAFDRLSREYPSTRDGLSLTERRILAAVADGEQTAETVFLRIAAREIRPYLGDTWAFAAMERLARSRVPLLDADGPVGIHTRLRLTTTGARVLDGAEDHVALNGIDRWIGGVHLAGAEARWRWHEGTETITPVRPA